MPWKGMRFVFVYKIALDNTIFLIVSLQSFFCVLITSLPSFFLSFTHPFTFLFTSLFSSSLFLFLFSSPHQQTAWAWETCASDESSERCAGGESDWAWGRECLSAHTARFASRRRKHTGCFSCVQTAQTRAAQRDTQGAGEAVQGQLQTAVRVLAEPRQQGSEDCVCVLFFCIVFLLLLFLPLLLSFIYSLHWLSLLFHYHYFPFPPSFVFFLLFFAFSSQGIQRRMSEQLLFARRLQRSQRSWRECEHFLLRRTEFVFFSSSFLLLNYFFHSFFLHRIIFLSILWLLIHFPLIITKYSLWYRFFSHSSTLILFFFFFLLSLFLLNILL